MGTVTTTTDKNLLIKQQATAMGEMIETSRIDLMRLMPPTMDFERLKEIMVYNFKLNPDLLKCDASSIMRSVFAFASMGLEPHPQFGEAFIIPFNNTKKGIYEATIQIGYKGLLKLAMNTGEIKSINCEVVRTHDEFDYQFGTNAFLRHKPNFLLTDEERGSAIAYYCVVSLKNGAEKFEIMSLSDVTRIQNSSPAARTGFSPWKTHFNEMAKKTVFRRASKWLPKAISRQYEQAIIVDNAGFEGKAIDVEVTETGVDIWAVETEDDTPKLEQSDESERLNNLLEGNQQTLLEANNTQTTSE